MLAVCGVRHSIDLAVIDFSGAVFYCAENQSGRLNYRKPAVHQTTELGWRPALIKSLY